MKIQYLILTFVLTFIVLLPSEFAQAQFELEGHTYHKNSNGVWVTPGQPVCGTGGCTSQEIQASPKQAEKLDRLKQVDDMQNTEEKKEEAPAKGHGQANTDDEEEKEEKKLTEQEQTEIFEKINELKKGNPDITNADLKKTIDKEFGEGAFDSYVKNNTPKPGAGGAPAPAPAPPGGGGGGGNPPPEGPKISDLMGTLATLLGGQGGKGENNPNQPQEDPQETLNEQIINEALRQQAEREALAEQERELLAAQEQDGQTDSEADNEIITVESGEDQDEDISIASSTITPGPTDGSGGRTSQTEQDPMIEVIS